MFEFMHVRFFYVIPHEMTKHTQPWTNSCCHNRNILAHLMGCVGAGLIKFQLYTQSFRATWIVWLLVRETLDAIGTICDGLVLLVKLYFYYLSQSPSTSLLTLSSLRYCRFTLCCLFYKHNGTTLSTINVRVAWW